VRRFLTAHQHKAILCHSPWFTLKTQDRRQIKMQTIKKLNTNPEKSKQRKMQQKKSALV